MRTEDYLYTALLNGLPRRLRRQYEQVREDSDRKAIRAVMMEISEYLSRAMVEQGDCMAEYQAKESSRREKTKKAIKLD